MLFIEGHCPHCNEKRGFNLFSASQYRLQRGVSLIQKQATRGQAKPAKFYACGVCIHCNNPILVDIEIPDIFLFEMQECIGHHDKTYLGDPPQIQRIYPEPTPPYSHPSLPDTVNQDLIDLQNMLKQNIAPHLVMTGCRTILESVVKELGGEGKRLIDQIKDLKAKAIVNGVLEDWALHIRLEGNSAVHERSGTHEEAQELMEFTKLFLQYTFEFPSRITALRTPEAS